MSSMITIGADSTSPVTQAFLIDQAILADQNAVEGSFVPIRQLGSGHAASSSMQRGLKLRGLSDMNGMALCNLKETWLAICSVA